MRRQMSESCITTNSINKKILIRCEEDDERHPHCPHGPTLLFYTFAKGLAAGYYACSAHRDQRSCSFRLPSTELTTNNLSRRYEMPLEEYRALRHKYSLTATTAEDGASAVREQKHQQRHYCLSCNVPMQPADLSQHIGHEIMHNLSPQLLQQPTQFLRALDNDKVQAQYFFDQRALTFFSKCFIDVGINKVVCLGAPRLHEYLRSQHASTVRSFLLDFDHRFYFFYEDEHFAWHNMCNNHFFDERQALKFREFLQYKDASERLLIFTDPPFGCRTEPIAHTLRQLTRLHNSLNALPHQPLPIFWIFPYFAEPYVRQQMPELQMCDYKVNYSNHAAYTNIGEKRRKLGSPVRVFTNVPLERLVLPIEEGGYKYCAACQGYTALENRHCAKCGTCPAKNGSTYRHCERCGTCVKPTYVHCGSCRRCAQVEGHTCDEYQAQQRCWICRQLGHTEHDCKLWRKYCKRKISFSCGRDEGSEIVCLLCEQRGHNERDCKQRVKYIEEFTFLGETKVTFKS